MSSGDKIAAPVDTSLAVTDTLTAVDASVSLTPVGDVYVAERVSDPAVVFGSEPSGAWIWPEESHCPDGPLAAVKLGTILAKNGSLHELVTEIDSYPIHRSAVEVGNKRAVMDEIVSEASQRYGEVHSLDGDRVERDGGWFLLRASGTKPLIRVTAEARDPDTANKLFDEATTLVKHAN